MLQSAYRLSMSRICLSQIPEPPPWDARTEDEWKKAGELAQPLTAYCGDMMVKHAPPRSTSAFYKVS
jgi:hypothetical protein